MNTATAQPFGSYPQKAEVTRLPDGRIGIFIGGAYQFTDDTHAARLRDDLDEVLRTPAAAADLDAEYRVLERALVTERPAP